jgi:prepilin-type N-terminal cleavage/methylation domain-containing protein
LRRSRPSAGGSASATRGLTLLETLVALAITALILAALSGTIGRTARAHGAATNGAQRIAMARAVLLRLGQELEAADPGQRLLLVRDGGLRFGTFGRGDGEPLFVAYDLDPVVGTLVRRQAPARGRVEQQAGLTLLAGIGAFRARVLDTEGWHREWQADTLPLAVEIGLRQGDEDLAVRVALPAAR